jgi:6-methylsalicylate decarboxylase
LKTENYEKWDVHHHINPEFLADGTKSIGVTEASGVNQPKWTKTMLLKMMEKHNITKAYMSTPTASAYFNDDLFSRRLTRRCNEYMSNMIKEYPGKFGAFASVPLQDVAGAIEELKYSLDVLKLDGIALFSNVNGKYLGAEEYQSFFGELNQRNAIVFIHPNTPPKKADHKLLNSMYLWRLDTTRTMIDFVRSGYHRDFPNIKFILSHGGGVLPAIYPTLLKRLKEENPAIESEFEKWKTQLYLDTARVKYRDDIWMAINFVGINHILLGTDYVWAKNNFVSWLKMISTLNTEKTYIQDIFKRNAEKALTTCLKNPIINISIPGVEAYKSVDKENNNKTKYHFHCTPIKVVEYMEKINTSLSADKIDSWDINRAIKWMTENNYKKIMLSFDIPQIWDYKINDIAAILNLYNKEVAEIRNKDPQRLGAFGAIDVENVELALNEIDYCLNDLRLNGICIYTNIYDKPLEDTFDLRILKKLKNAGVSILVHPKNSRGIPIANENYLDSVYFIVKMLYLGKFEYLSDNKYILAHTGGIVPFIADEIGLLYYIQLNKAKTVKLIFDWLKNIKGGFEFLKGITKKIVIDD